MALTIGTAPFGTDPGGVLNATVEGPERVIWWEDHPRRVRVTVGGEVVAESSRMKLLHETGELPVYYFPDEDVRSELLEPSDHHTWCPYKGRASYRSVRVGDRLAEDAAWRYPEPIEGAPPLAGYTAFFWHRMDRWYEEDEEVFVHAPDPYHRIDCRRSSRHVRVALDGVVLAESDRPTVLFETGLPPRFYLSPADVRSELLEPSDAHTECPYKGRASYRSVRVRGALHEDLVWCYPQALPEATKVQGLLCFYNERVDLEVDGEAWDRPVTKFS